jgi:tetratricopeptide (TPR) repeat protein
MNATHATDGLVAHGRIGRGQRAWSRLWQVPTFFFGLMLFLAAAISSSFRDEMREGPFNVDVRRLRDGLRDGVDPQQLTALAERLLGDVRRHPRREGELNFLAGSAYYRLAMPTAKHGAASQKAIEYLERALLIGVSDPDVPALHHRLGVMLYRRGDEPNRAAQLMAESIEQGADQPRPAYAMLVNAYLTAPVPDINAALAANQKLLELTVEPEAQGEARYLRAELLLKKEMRSAALKELDRIGGRISSGLRIKTKLLLAQTAEDEGLYHRAAATWKELLADAAHVPGGQARILLAHGHCLASADPPDHAAAAAAWQQALEQGGPAGQAAGLRLGEFRWFAVPRQPAKALEAWTAALRDVRTPKDYHNAHFELARARDLLDRACRHALERRDFEHAQQAAELYKKFSAPGAADERWARAVEAQAEEKLARAAGADKVLLQQAHAQFHQAGVVYEQAALAGPEDKRLDACWRAAQCYLAARDHARAAAALERFVTDSKDEARLAQAWLLLAETQANLGKKEQARQAYYKCMEFPATPFAWRARYQLAVDEMERKNFAHAKEILKQNLTVTAPGMDRDAHEKSIYKMAGLLLMTQAYDEAVWVLKEAARQYPNNPSALAARDRLADCYRKLAEQTQQKIQQLGALKREGLSPERAAELEQLKAHQQNARRQWLEQAIGVYQTLADELLRKAAQKTLTNDEAITVREALFGLAELHFDRGDFAEALRRYQRLQRDYAKQVESLHACMGVWRCVAVMVESPAQARAARAAAQQAITTARAELDTIPADHPGFRGAGAWTKENWLTWLDWVNVQLNPATPVTNSN